MISKADMPRGNALTRLYERTTGPAARTRRTTTELRPATGEPDVEPIPCDDADALLDLAELRSGILPDDEIDRLAAHVLGCEACQMLVEILVRDALNVESSGERIVR